MEQAAQDLFKSRSSDKLQFEVELMVPPAPLGECWLQPSIELQCSGAGLDS